MNKVANTTISLSNHSNKKIDISNDNAFTLIAGPCVIESLEHSLFMADNLVNICNKVGINLVFKSSFDKANRTSIKSVRGVRIEKGLEILATIKEKYKVPIITDVHEASQCNQVASVVDILQIPAFLCRQTDLILAAAHTNKPVSIKKGQFLAPWDMQNIVDKFTSSGNKQVMLCERGSSFGYNRLVVDMTSLKIMSNTGCPVIFDATHSVQCPGGQGTTSGGNRDMVECLAKAAVAIGVAGVFVEVHQDPSNAPSDGPNMIALSSLEKTLIELKKLDSLVKNKVI